MNTNSKPRAGREDQQRGNMQYANNNSTTALGESKSRYEKGLALYKEGKVRIGENGLFKVSGYYEVDTERMSCNCPDYTTRKQECKHVWAACLFVKNRGKQSIEDLDGHGNGTPSKQAANKPQEARSKDFDRQAVITRLATINSAIEALKTHRKPIEYNDIVSLAAQLEQWALGDTEK